ncbi:polyketide cyclase [Vulcanisaeta distributa]|uniref:SRPBCC family protein n=1 Tax=Vulcanisaeta distributa TaxID=164451 RepID=UPI0006D2BA20|nr:SRPBCC family protein [Vulcanisaeta distributa]
MSILDIEFTVSRKVNPGDLERVWQVLSDVRNMPRYWRGGHREVEILSKDGNTYMVRIRFAFPGPGNEGVARIEVHDLEKIVLINYLNGPIRGYVRNYISGNQLISQWDVRISPLFLVMKPWIRKHFMSGTINALTRILNEVTNIK